MKWAASKISTALDDFVFGVVEDGGGVGVGAGGMATHTRARAYFSIFLTTNVYPHQGIQIRRFSTTVCHVVLPRDTALQAGAGGLAISDAGYAFLSMHFDAKPRRDDTNMFWMLHDMRSFIVRLPKLCLIWGMFSTLVSPSGWIYGTKSEYLRNPLAPGSIKSSQCPFSDDQSLRSLQVHYHFCVSQIYHISNYHLLPQCLFRTNTSLLSVQRQVLDELLQNAWWKKERKLLSLDEERRDWMSSSSNMERVQKQSNSTLENCPKSRNLLLS